MPLEKKTAVFVNHCDLLLTDCNILNENFDISEEERRNQRSVAQKLNVFMKDIQPYSQFYLNNAENRISIRHGRFPQNKISSTR